MTGINEKEIDRVLGIDFLQEPELFEAEGIVPGGLIIGYNNVNFPFVLYEDGVYQLALVGSNDQWTKTFIARTLEEFQSTLKIFAESFTGPGIMGRKIDMEVLHGILMKVLLKFPNCNVQFWIDEFSDT